MRTVNPPGLAGSVRVVERVECCAAVGRLEDLAVGGGVHRGCVFGIHGLGRTGEFGPRCSGSWGDRSGGARFLERVENLLARGKVQAAADAIVDRASGCHVDAVDDQGR